MSIRRLDRELLLDFVHQLDALELTQFCEYDDVCPRCGTQYYGILDESRLTLPIGGLFRSLYGRRGSGLDWSGPSHQFMVHGVDTRRFGVQFLRNYEIRMDIVRSGMFTRDQLHGGLFNQHELEVSERSFTSIRPRRCDCDFGTPPEFSENEKLAFLAGISEPVAIQTAVEDSFVESGPLRTGFRRRSVDARRRRSRSRGKSPTSLTRTVIAQVPRAVAHKVPEDLKILRSEVVINFKEGAPLNKRRRNRKMTGHKPAAKPPKRAKRAPKPHHTKYWYFFRSRGFYTHSVHHPYGDEL